MNEKFGRVSGVMDLKAHDRLKQKLKKLGGGRKLSVVKFLEAALDVSDEIMQPLVDAVIVAKTTRGESVARKLNKLSPAAFAKVQIIMDDELSGE